MPYELMPEVAPEPENESMFSQGLRSAARTGSRVLEQAVGLPGDIFSLINEYVAKPVTEKITGEEGLPYEKTYLGKLLPTTQEHRKGTEGVFGEYVKPQNEYERFVDDIVQDATAIAIPGMGPVKKAKTAFNALAISTASNSLGEVVKDLTSDEKKGSFAKLGSLLMLSLFNKPAATKAIGELYKPLNQKASMLSPVDATGLENSLNSVKSKVSKGTLAPSEKFVFDEADLVLQKIKNGMITPEEAWAAKRSLNEKMSKILFDIPKKSDQVRAKTLAQGITHSLDETLKQTAKQDPKFYKDLKAADKAFAVIAKSNFATRVLENNLKYNPVTHGLAHLFLGAAGTSSGMIIPYAVGKVLYRISKSPELAKHYGKIVKAATTEDAATLNREMMKLDHKLQKEEKKDKFVLIE